MGIKGFAGWLRSSFPQAFCALPARKSATATFDQVYVDLNPFLHMAARVSQSTDSIMSTFKRMLRHSLENLARPQSLLYVAMDGPAALVKLPEQRARRKDAAVNSLKRGSFDAQQITPGCSFMTAVEAELYGWMHSSLNAKLREAVLDGAACPGEGEYKIIRRLLNDHLDLDALKGRVTRAVLGVDNDMFLQALLCEVPHVYLIDPFAGAGSQVACFSVDRWRRALAASHSSREARRVALDFALIVLMSGSDYVPPLKYTNYKTLWPCYLDMMQQRSGCEEGGPLEKRIRTERSFLVDAGKKSVNLEALKTFYQRYLATVLPDSLRVYLDAHHETLDPAGRDERILQYFEHMIWNLDALATADTPDDPAMTGECEAPSLVELAEMPAAELQVQLDARMKLKQKRYETRMPGVMAMMLLDRESDCDGYLPAALRPIYADLKSKQLSDLEFASEATERIKSLSDLTIPEKITIFTRKPIVMSNNNNTKNLNNFFTVAMGQMSEAESVTMTALPWLRSYVHEPDEEESLHCPLYQNLFKK